MFGSYIDGVLAKAEDFLGGDLIQMATDVYFRKEQIDADAKTSYVQTQADIEADKSKMKLVYVALVVVGGLVILKVARKA